MSEPQPGETKVGRHTLGPHVVGRRIVVRHLLPDGSATDVLGTCTTWGSRSLTVDRDGHGPVEIALSDVVTGKPVPPRASVRARVPAREVELHVGALWRSITTEPLGDWLLRASPPHDGRLRRRGNSALAMDAPGIGWADAVWGVREFYAALEQEPMIQVQLGSPVEQTLATLGFVPMGDGDAHAQLAPIASALRSLRATAPDVRAELVESDGRAAAFLEGSLATGRGVLSGDWLLVEGLVVDPAHRRRGLASGVLAELLDWGASQGARTAMLHVETANTGAQALYERHGFVTHHTNRYLVAR
jgi:ribosomal protein S18 acetylase RimI-like enzyme